MNVLFRFRACGWIGLGVMALSPSYAVDFDKQILPILEEKCYRCHGDEKVKGELRLDSPEAILAGGEYGEILIPGDPNESSLYVLTTYPKDDADYMADCSRAEVIETVDRGWGTFWRIVRSRACAGN